MIECDMALTNDHAIICSHAPYLGQSTDISMKPEFADRLTTYNMDDDDPAVDWNDKGDITDWFSFDFSLEELRSLRVKQVLTFCGFVTFFGRPIFCLFTQPTPHCQCNPTQLTQLSRAYLSPKTSLLPLEPTFRLMKSVTLDLTGLRDLSH